MIADLKNNGFLFFFFKKKKENGSEVDEKQSGWFSMQFVTSFL
jgi:hypothetical protein